MKQEGHKLCLIFLLGMNLTAVTAQEAVPASGGEASGSGGSVSFSVGQQLYITHTSAAASIAEGVQQVYIISPVTGLPDTEGINLGISAYPNPTLDFLTLNIADYSNENISYQLIDLEGRLLEKNKTEGRETKISVSKCAHGAYFLKVMQGNKEIKTFKIVRE